MAMPTCPKCGGTSFSGMSWGLGGQSGMSSAYPNILGCTRCGTPIGTYVSPAVYDKLLDGIEKIAKKLGVQL